MLSLTYPRKAIIKSAVLQYVILASGCMSWRTETVAPAELIQRKPSVVRITRSDSTRLVLRDPEIRGDTLYGSSDTSTAEVAKGPIGTPLTSVIAVETRRSDPNKTVLLAAGIAVGTFSMLCFGADAFGCGNEDIVARAALK